VRARAVSGAYLLSIAMLYGSPARAASTCSRLAPWNRVGSSLGHFIEPLPLGLVAASPVPLLALAPTGLDHELRLASQKNLGGRYHLEPVSYFAPYVLAGAALVGLGVGALAGACEVERPLSAVLQGMSAGLVATGLLKWSVGRGWPNDGKDPHGPDRLTHPENARRFQPFRSGLGAWPSGHTLSMFAAAAAFRGAEYELGLARFAGYPLAVAVGAGMWLGDRHWASDVLSGALLGEAIGSSVGQAFGRSEDMPEHAGMRGGLVAMPLDGGMLVGWTSTW
jgi:membrane-associated phospholipid phosphatase